MRRKHASTLEPLKNAVLCRQSIWKGLHIPHPQDPNRVIPEGCFSEAGLEMLTLPADFCWMGPAAFEHCDKLQTVDISRTEINEILGGTFARRSQLQHLKLAKTLRRIEREAFLRCTSLEEIHTPPALLYINKRAFAGCTQLCKLVRMGKKGTWRGTYAEYDAFETCTKLALPGFGFSPSAML